MTTYTRRGNARRAALKAGIAKEQIAITVHKNGDEVRFGWKATAQLSRCITATPKGRNEPTRTQRLERNGVKRPNPGGLCASVWDHLDAHPTTTLAELRTVASSNGWNQNNTSCEYYAWRKFNGVSGRT